MRERTEQMVRSVPAASSKLPIEDACPTQYVWIGAETYCKDGEVGKGRLRGRVYLHLLMVRGYLGEDSI